MKKISTLIAMLALALATAFASAPSAGAAGTVTLKNRTGGTYVGATQCAPWGSCTIWYPSNGSQLSNTKCFKPNQVVHSQWGGGYFPGNVYCFGSTASGDFILYYGIG